MDYEQNHPKYLKDGSGLDSNGHNGFLDSDPAMMYVIKARDAAQAEKVMNAFVGLHGEKAYQHVHRKGNMLHLTPDGLSKLEICAAMAQVHVKPKDAKLIRGP